MAQIRTIDGERHNVVESKREIDELMACYDAVELGLLKLNLIGQSSNFNGKTTRIEEPATFFITGIIVYY